MDSKMRKIIGVLGGVKFGELINGYGATALFGVVTVATVWRDERGYWYDDFYRHIQRLI